MFIMAKDDVKDELVWVSPTSRGQRPDGVWTDLGGNPFQVLKSRVSSRWQTPVSEDEAKALDKALKANKASEAKGNALAPELTAALAEVDRLTAELAAMTKERDDLAKTPVPEPAPSPGSAIAGQMKPPGKSGDKP